MHDHPPGRVEPVGGLGLAHRPQTGAEFVVGQDPKAEMLVEGPVPGNMAKRGEGQCCHVLAGCPLGGLLDQRPSESSALVVRGHADLLDMGGPVDRIYQYVAHRCAFGVRRHPYSPPSGVVRQRLDGGRFVVGNLVESELPEALARRPLYLPKDR